MAGTTMSTKAPVMTPPTNPLTRTEWLPAALSDNLFPLRRKGGFGWGAPTGEHHAKQQSRSPIMTSADPPLRSGEAADEPEIDDTDDALPEDEDEFVSEETGIDLTDASELDADNVPADEEFDRVMQAPD